MQASPMNTRALSNSKCKQCNPVVRHIHVAIHVACHPVYAIILVLAFDLFGLISFWLSWFWLLRGSSLHFVLVISFWFCRHSRAFSRATPSQIPAKRFHRFTMILAGAWPKRFSRALTGVRSLRDLPRLPFNCYVSLVFARFFELGLSSPRSLDQLRRLRRLLISFTARLACSKSCKTSSAPRSFSIAILGDRSFARLFAQFAHLFWEWPPSEGRSPERKRQAGAIPNGDCSPFSTARECGYVRAWRFGCRTVKNT